MTSAIAFRRWGRRVLRAAIVLMLVAPTPAGADERQPRSDAWQGSLGLRTSFIGDSGLDPFAQKDVVAQASLGLLRRVIHADRWGLFAGVNWDIGSSDAAARGLSSRLTLNHPAAVVELRSRVTAISRLHLFARVAPGLIRASFRLNDPSSVAPLENAFTTLAVDGSAGLGVRLNRERDAVGLAMRLEGGYGWAERRDVTLRPALEGADAAHAGAIVLEPLALRGAFVRAALVVSY